jgi:hypothetical protein
MRSLFFGVNAGGCVPFEDDRLCEPPALTWTQVVHQRKADAPALVR